MNTYYTILNDNGTEVKSTKEVRDYFRYEQKCTFLGGYPNSYILLTKKDYESIDIVADFLGHTIGDENSDYWYASDNNSNDSYDTFGDQFGVLEFLDAKALKERLR